MTNAFKKRFSKLDFLKAVSVTITANSEQIKIEKSITPTNFVFSLSPPPLPRWFFKNWSHSYPIFWNFHRPFKKEERLVTMCILLKIYEIILPLFVCTRWNILMFCECFYCCLLSLICFFKKIFPHFYD